MKSAYKITLRLMGFALGFIILFGGYSIITRGVGNTFNFLEHKVDDGTNYETIKKVEDTCRASISSYEADKLTWEQYMDSESKLERSWAEQAKIRANKTASTYNNYILKNSFVWNGNIPHDIYHELPFLK